MLAIQSGSTSTGPTVSVPDLVFNAVFVFELFVKVIGFGLLNTGKSAYLRDAWNKGDLVILIGSIAGKMISVASCTCQSQFVSLYDVQQLSWTRSHQAET